MGQQENTQFLKENYKRTGSPHGIMPTEEAAIAFTKKWERVRQSVPVEDRQEIEPLLEMLLGKAVYSSPEAARTFTNAVSGSTSS